MLFLKTNWLSYSPVCTCRVGSQSVSALEPTDNNAAAQEVASSAATVREKTSQDKLASRVTLRIKPAPCDDMKRTAVITVVVRAEPQLPALSPMMPSTTGDLYRATQAAEVEDIIAAAMASVATRDATVAAPPEATEHVQQCAPFSKFSYS